MCHYIAAVMSADGDELAIREVAKSLSLGWKPLQNRSVTGQLREGERCYLTTHGCCDCGTHFGIDVVSEESVGISAAEKLKRIRQKGLKKGWTNAKIDRALDQARLEQERRPSQAHDKSDLDRLRNLVAQVFSERMASHIGLFLHYYESTLESEEIVLTKRRWIDLIEFDETIMRNTPENSPLFVSNR